MTGSVVTDPRDTHVRTTQRRASATQRREARAARPARSGRPAVPARGTAPAHRAVRLTRRGRVAALVGTASVLALGGVVLGRGVAAAGSLAGEQPPAVIVVGPGETLWLIAGQIAPNVDRRITVDRLQEANALSGSLVVPGQSLIVPADL